MPDGSAPRPGPQDSPAAAPEPAPAGSGRQPCLGRIVALDGAGRPRVEFAGCPQPPPIARLIGAVDPAALRAAVDDRRSVLLAFLDGRGDQPVVMSLASGQDLPSAPPPAAPAGPAGDDGLTIEIDGEARVIEAAHKLVLRCGEAAIELDADGGVRILGRDITSWARRRQRIRGGSVAIN